MIFLVYGRLTASEQDFLVLDIDSKVKQDYKIFLFARGAVRLNKNY